MSKHSRSKRVIQQGKDAVQPANETEGMNTVNIEDLSLEQAKRVKHEKTDRGES